MICGAFTQSSDGAHFCVSAQGPFNSSSKSNKRHFHTIRQDLLYDCVKQRSHTCHLQLQCKQDRETERRLHRKEVTFLTKKWISEKVIQAITCNFHTMMPLVRAIFGVIFTCVCYLMNEQDTERRLHEKILNHNCTQIFISCVDLVL